MDDLGAAGRLAESLVARARERDITIATIESCTAGALASALSRPPGAGGVLHGGFVAYSKPQKIALGVPEGVIARHSAVSQLTAEALARAALSHSPAKLVIAITGVAGPEPDEDGNPVGLVYVSAGRRCGGFVTEKHTFAGDHDAICAQAMAAGLRLAEALIADGADEPQRERAPTA